MPFLHERILIILHSSSGLAGHLNISHELLQGPAWVGGHSQRNEEAQRAKQELKAINAVRGVTDTLSSPPERAMEPSEGWPFSYPAQFQSLTAPSRRPFYDTIGGLSPHDPTFMSMQMAFLALAVASVFIAYRLRS